MKKIINLKTILILSLFTIFISCNDEREIVTTPTVLSEDNTVYGKALRNADLTTFVSAVEKANLKVTLQTGASLTVFAPNNAAFTSFLTTNGYANLDAVPFIDLRQLLLYHVVGSTLKSTELTNNSYLASSAVGKASTTNPLSLFLNTTSGVLINGISNVTTKDLESVNGVIHVVNKVLSLPTVVSHATSNPNLSQLVGLITDGTQADVVTALSATTSKTVFAPTNNAFVSALAAGGFLFGNVTQPNVNSVLKYHVITGNRLAASLANNSVINTFFTLPSQKTFKISIVSGSVKIIDTTILPAATVTKANIQCNDGAIHIIDGVLNPFL